jgi:hypothetical protein
MSEGKYTIELCLPGGVRAGAEGVIASDDDLTTAQKLYRAAAADNPGTSIWWCHLYMSTYVDATVVYQP